MKVDDLSITVQIGTTRHHRHAPTIRMRVDVPFTIENSRASCRHAHEHRICEFGGVPSFYCWRCAYRHRQCKEKEGELFHFWFHAAMLHGKERLVWRKWMLDGLKMASKKFDATSVLWRSYGRWPTSAWR